MDKKRVDSDRLASSEEANQSGSAQFPKEEIEFWISISYAHSMLAT